jgi:hypothetical protein
VRPKQMFRLLLGEPLLWTRGAPLVLWLAVAPRRRSSDPAGRADRYPATCFFVGVGAFGAGEGNRTLVISLEGCCSTIELHPRRKLTIGSVSGAIDSRSRRTQPNANSARAPRGCDKFVSPPASAVGGIAQRISWPAKVVKIASITQMPLRADVNCVVEGSVSVCIGTGGRRQHDSPREDKDRQDFHGGPGISMTRR